MAATAGHAGGPSQVAADKRHDVGGVVSIPTEVAGIIFHFLDPEAVLRSREVSTDWRRLASDDDVWRALFGELITVSPAIALWPRRAEGESCARWYFRCRAHAFWSQGVGKAYNNNEFPHLNQLGIIRSVGAEATFIPDVALSFPVAYGVLAELVLLSRRRGVSETKSYDAAASYFTNTPGAPKELRRRIADNFKDQIAPPPQRHGPLALVVYVQRRYLAE